MNEKNENQSPSPAQRDSSMVSILTNLFLAYIIQLALLLTIPAFGIIIQKVKALPALIAGLWAGYRSPSTNRKRNIVGILRLDVHP
jgi:hypothetical protein